MGGALSAIERKARPSMGEQISLFWGDPSLPREYLTSSERRLRTRLLDAVWPRTRGHVHVEHRSEVPVRGVGVSRDTPTQQSDIAVS